MVKSWQGADFTTKLLVKLREISVCGAKDSQVRGVKNVWTLRGAGPTSKFEMNTTHLLLFSPPLFNFLIFVFSRAFSNTPILFYSSSSPAPVRIETKTKQIYQLKLNTVLLDSASRTQCNFIPFSAKPFLEIAHLLHKYGKLAYRR